MTMNQTQSTTLEASVEKTVDTLNGFLRGEVSAVETYRQARSKIDDVQLRSNLEDLGRSHETRAALLRNQISRLGGMPSESSGIWGSFAKAIEGGAKVLGVKSALSALEEGEDHGLRLYRDNLDKLDSAARAFVERELLPSQQQSHDRMSRLKHAVH